MIRINNLQDIALQEKEGLDKYKGILMVCNGTGCVSAGGFDIKQALTESILRHRLEEQYLVVGTGCNGFCAVGPICVLEPDGIFYQKLTPDSVEEIVTKHLKGGQVVKELLFTDDLTDERIEKMKDIKFFAKQYPIALRNKGLIDPENIYQYISRRGYRSLRKIITEMTPDKVLNEIKKSGIRGRGGGGFPAGVKWESAKKAVDRNVAEAGPLDNLEDLKTVYVVCNADEGDPGAYMDRSIIETDPHTVIEGMLIGAYAVGAKEGFIYIRKEYPLALQRLRTAIDQARTLGILGNNIMGSDFSFDIHIHRGAGAFVCGESTALMTSMSGLAGEPRAKYIHTVEKGYRDKPTVLNNVETWANIPVIIDKGADWFASIGTGDVSENPWNGSSGTKVFSLVGNIRNSGLVEVPMGITLREIIYDIGGGIPDNKKFKAVQTGGPSGGCLPESKLDMSVDFDSLTAAGSMMGSGGMIVMDENSCMVDVARYFIDFLVDESCGKCTPCREGLSALKRILERICQGKGVPEDIEALRELSETVADTSLCQLGATAPNPVLSTMKYFEDEYREHINQKKCRAGICKDLIEFSILKDKCTGCTLCYKNCPVEAVSGKVKQLHVIDKSKCIKCGICYEVCKFNAVEVK